MRPRAWRIMMWTALAATVICAAGAVGTRTGGAGILGPGGIHATVQHSCLSFGREGGASHQGWEVWPARAAYFAPAWFSFDRWWDGASFWNLTVSLWLLASTTIAVSSFSAFMAHRTRRRSGHCPKCGYDLSGLPTAVCPECGEKVRGSIAG